MRILRISTLHSVITFKLSSLSNWCWIRCLNINPLISNSYWKLSSWIWSPAHTASRWLSISTWSSYETLTVWVISSHINLPLLLGSICLDLSSCNLNSLFLILHFGTIAKVLVFLFYTFPSDILRIFISSPLCLWTLLLLIFSFISPLLSFCCWPSLLLYFICALTLLLLIFSSLPLS